MGCTEYPLCKYAFYEKQPNKIGRAAGKQPRPLRLLTTFASTSPKGRGLGKEMKFAWTAKGSPLGGAGAIAPERARPLP